MNFILIGMPNSGKTTLGKKAAAALGMRFYDTDILAGDKLRAKNLKSSYFQFVRAFPAAEEAVVRSIAKKAVNAIIATGGETALSEKNVQILRQAGRFIHIRRDPDRMLKEIAKRNPPDPKRPELRHMDEFMVTLYRDMMPEYEKLADFTVENDGDEDTGLEKLVNIIRAQSAR